MGLWVRRSLALIGIAAALALGPFATAWAETTPPTPPASAGASPTSISSEPADDGGEDLEDTPSAPLTDTRTVIVLIAAGVVALAAGAVVFLRR